MTNLIATAEIKGLRRAKAPRHVWLTRADYFAASATSYAASFAADLADWEAGAISRPDLADPRDPAVAAARAALVASSVEVADMLRNAAPEA